MQKQYCSLGSRVLQKTIQVVMAYIAFCAHANSPACCCTPQGICSLQAVLDITGGVVSDPMLFQSVMIEQITDQSRILKVIWCIQYVPAFASLHGTHVGFVFMHVTFLSYQTCEPRPIKNTMKEAALHPIPSACCALWLMNQWHIMFRIRLLILAISSNNCCVQVSTSCLAFYIHSNLLPTH